MMKQKLAHTSSFAVMQSYSSRLWQCKRKHKYFSNLLNLFRAWLQLADIFNVLCEKLMVCSTMCFAEW